MERIEEILKAALKIDSLETELSRDPDEGITRKATIENTTIEDIEMAVEYLIDEALPRLKEDTRDEGKSTISISEEILKVRKFDRTYLATKWTY